MGCCPSDYAVGNATRPTDASREHYKVSARWFNRGNDIVGYIAQDCGKRWERAVAYLGSTVAEAKALVSQPSCIVPQEANICKVEA